MLATGTLCKARPQPTAACSALPPPQVTTELRTLYGADHPNVVRYYAAFFDNGAITIAMEYCDAGSLADLLKVGAQGAGDPRRAGCLALY